MNNPPYPRAGASFFANRFLVFALRSGVNMDHGAQAFALLAAVVLTEDRTRYTKGVKFWNDNLTAYLGCREDRLIEVRGRLVRGGWLHYSAGRKGVAGEYWVLVPGGDSRIDDSLLGPNLHSDNPEGNADSLPEIDSGKAQCNSELHYGIPEGKTGGIEGEVALSLRNSGGQRVVQPVAILPIPIPKYGEEAVAFEFPLKGGKPWTLTAEKLREYQTSFPGVDIEAELRTARQWCLDNATKRKTAGGMPRFLSRWLARNPKRLSAPVAARQSSTKGQAELTQGFGRDWAGITPELLRSPSQVMAWFDSQTSIPDTDENRVWCLASAKDASGPTIENPAALFVSLGKKLTQGQRSAPGDESYDWAKTQMRLWRAHSQAKYVHQGDAEPIQLRRASELTGAFV